MRDKSLQKIFFPILKADFSYIAHHPPLITKILETPISTLCGDAEKITPDEMAKWEKYTRGTYEHQTLSGGHFTISERQKEYLAFILSRLGKDRAKMA